MMTGQTLGRVLVVDDEAGMRLMLSTYLKGEGYEVTTAQDGVEAEELLKKDGFDAVVTDLNMPGRDGLTLLRNFRAFDEDTPVIVMSAYGSTDSALAAMRAGAFDYVFKPFQTDEILFSLKKAETQRRLKKENEQLRKTGARPERLIHKSRAMEEVAAFIERVAEADFTVLITGESGTGKELAARAIHEGSSRRGRAFVAVNCGAISESLLESELFGHLKGAFTGAVRDREGLFRAAHGGTLFLDEIGELPPPFQVKLLRAIQFSEVVPVGGETPIKFDARLVAATSRDLDEMVRGHLFREDLFYRLSVLPLKLPPLRTRPEDIPLLAAHFAAGAAARLGRAAPGLDESFLAAITAYGWPGNVRELENIMDRAVIMAADPTRLTRGDLPPALSGCPAEARPVSENLDLKAAIRDLEARYIAEALRRSQGNRSEAARVLGLSYPSLLNKIKSYKIDS